jgi:hypothetical protein
VGTAAPAVAPTGGKSITLGHLTITKGAVAAPVRAPAPAPAPTPDTPRAGAPEQPKETPAPTGAPTSAPATLPRGPPVAGNNDISQVSNSNKK